MPTAKQLAALQAGRAKRSAKASGGTAVLERDEPVTSHEFDDSGIRPPNPEDEVDEWDGIPTTLRLGYPIFRGEGGKFFLVGRDEPCIGWYDPATNTQHPPCKRGGVVDRSHQIHVRANFMPLPAGTTNASGMPIVGRWVGPEGGHVEDLFAVGCILGTPQFDQRTRDIHEIDALRGTYGSKDRPQGWPELIALDAPKLRELLRRARQPFDAAEALRVERQTVGQEVAVLKAALKLMGIDIEAFVAQGRRNLEREGKG